MALLESVFVAMVLHVAIPLEIMDFQPTSPLQLDSKAVAKCFREAAFGCSPGPGECANEMLRVCLDDHELLQLLFSAAKTSPDHDSMQKPDGRGGERNRNWHGFLEARCQVSGTTVCQDCGISLFSIDCVGAYDHVYCSAMLARFAYGETTTCVWEDEEGPPQRDEGREEQHDPR